MIKKLVMELKQYIRPEFELYYEQFNKNILLNTLCKCEYDYVPDIIQQQDITLIGWKNLSSNPAEWVHQLLVQNPKKNTLL